MDGSQPHWYALKVFYNKMFEFEHLLRGVCLQTFFPVEKVRLKGEEYSRALRRMADPEDVRAAGMYFREGPFLFRRRPMVSSLMFVRADESRLGEIDKLVDGRGFLYKKAVISEDGTRHFVPQRIPDKEMSIFMMVASSGAEGLEFFADDEMTRYRQGARVRVLEGPLQGAEGYIKRIRKDRRLLVAVDGFIAVATSYIPPQFLEVVEGPSVPPVSVDS